MDFENFSYTAPGQPGGGARLYQGEAEPTLAARWLRPCMTLRQVINQY